MSLRFQRLTRPAVRAMQPGERINEHGVGAERQSNGDTRYSINVMVDGPAHPPRRRQGQRGGHSGTG